MIVAQSLEDFTRYRDSAQVRIGFVPTMGALHEGHLSLVRLARRRADTVIVSIFVNPTQFAPDEDFDAYPRHVERDLAMLEAAGVDCVFLPREVDIYPDGPQVSIKAGAAAQGLESDFRPHFFDGVCSVVHRLFTIVRPDLAVFGEKDYQQLMVIREMVAAHHMGIEIIGGPIVRDSYGLALSSRNAYLSADELAIARQLNIILSSRAKDPRSEVKGSDQIPPLASLGRNDILGAGFDKVDYIESRWNRILAAAWIGKTRLIDNMAAEI
ncbi:MAG: pantoate--beta-alanine ligase [Bdellovibrionales bacterium]